MMVEGAKMEGAASDIAMGCTQVNVVLGSVLLGVEPMQA